MYTAALANASKDLEEAAVVDGANILQQIWYVQLPAIKNIIVIQFILRAGNTQFQSVHKIIHKIRMPEISGSIPVLPICFQIHHQ